jgi:hypothetical protein
MAALCEKHCHATTWHHGDQLLVDGFFLNFIYNIGIYRFTFWHSNLNSRTWLVKTMIHTWPFWRSWCVLLCKFRVFMSLSIFSYVFFAWAAHKNDPMSRRQWWYLRKIDCCIKGTVATIVRRFLSSKFLLFCKEIKYPSDTYPSQF